MILSGPLFACLLCFRLEVVGLAFISIMSLTFCFILLQKDLAGVHVFPSVQE
jgi:hypothetical protein